MGIFSRRGWGRTQLLAVMLSVCVGMFVGKAYAQAGRWERDVISDKWGDVTGETYMQKLRPEACGGLLSDVSVLDFGVSVWGSKAAIVVKHSMDITIPISGYESDFGGAFTISLRDGNGNTQNFKGFGLKRPGVLEIRDAGFIQALKRETNYKILVNYSGNNLIVGSAWYVRADIRGGLPTGQNQQPVTPSASSGAQTSSAVSFTDPRDNKTYKTVMIGGKRWMAENLNYQTKSGSWCYGNSVDNCNKYGRLYDLETAKAACPAGWHLSSDKDWESLGKAVGGKKLKSKSGWNDYKGKSGNGTDDLGFSALPGGARYNHNSKFDDIGNEGNWWIATDNDDNIASYRSMYNYDDGELSHNIFNWRNYDDGKNNGYSARCVAGAVQPASAPSNQQPSNDAVIGARSKASIQRVVMQNMAPLRYAYSKRLREKPDLSGKITVKFSIDEFGRVLTAQMVESTMSDPDLESTVVARLRSWNFEKIDKPGDITEVTYPFVFAQ